VVCHGRGLSSGLDPVVTYIFYNQNIAFCSTITMVLDLLGLDHCMLDEDKTKSTQTCVILVMNGICCSFTIAIAMFAAVLLPLSLLQYCCHLI